MYDPEKEFFCEHTVSMLNPKSRHQCIVFTIQYIGGETLGSAIFVYIRGVLFIIDLRNTHMFAYLCLCWITF